MSSRCERSLGQGQRLLLFALPDVAADANTRRSTRTTRSTSGSHADSAGTLVFETTIPGDHYARITDDGLLDSDHHQRTPTTATRSR